MRKNTIIGFTIAVLVTISANPGEGQWETIVSQVGWDLVDLMFVSDITGFAVGTEGIIRTDNAGMDWSVASDEGGAAIWFWDANHGLLLRTSANVWETTNGGKTWEMKNQFLPSSGFRGIHYPLRLFFHNKKSGWAMFKKSLWRTFDGGRSWEISSIEFPEEIPPTVKNEGSPCCFGYHFRDIWFSDEQTGYAVGGYYNDVGNIDNNDGGMVYETENGGDDWNRNDPGCACHLGDVVGIPDGPVWTAASGEGVFRRSENSWVRLANPEGYEAMFRTQWSYGEFNWGFLSGVLLDSHTGWMAGDRIAHTQDGGDSWIIESEIGEHDMVFRMEKAGNRLVAVGANGLILVRDLPGSTSVFPASWGEVKNR